MFRRFALIARYFDAGTLASDWPGFVEREFTTQWDTKTVSGHVPFRDFQRAFRVAVEYPGLYLWGAGVGGAARIQYVGIATNLCKRLKGRYVLELTGGNARSAASREIGLALQHEHTLLKMADDFRVRGSTNVAKYAAAGIVVHKSRHSRLQRVERYAKVGLPNVWYALIPAPPGTTKKRLEDIETALINLSNATLYRAFANGDLQSRPLLNLQKVAKVSPWLTATEQVGYSAWLNGSWHSAPYAFALSVPAGDTSNSLPEKARSSSFDDLPADTPRARSRRARTDRRQRASARERFPLKKFYPFARADRFGIAADDIEGMSFPKAFKRGSTVRRGKAISTLERAGELEVFIKAHWPYGQTPNGLAELKSCLALAKRWDGGEFR